MSDAAVHRSFQRSTRRIDVWIWLGLHVYAILCLAGTGDLSPHRPVGALCFLQFILAPTLLIYMLVTRPGMTRSVRLIAVGSVLFVVVVAAIYLASRTDSKSDFDFAVFWVLFAGILSPFIIVAGLLIGNCFAILALLIAKKPISAVSVFLISLALAGLTFSPKSWMWREVPWALYYAAADRFASSREFTNQPSSIRRIRRGADVFAEWGGAPCQTEVYYVRAYSSRGDLSNQIAKLENFPFWDPADSGSSGVVERAIRIAPGYVLAYTCY